MSSATSQKAMKFWTEVQRVGPFFYIPKVKTDWFRYRGIGFSRSR